jgi:hypothetical protein
VKGPTPKPPELRQRRNRTSTRAAFVVDEEPRLRAPSLPKISEGYVWHPLTEAWWRDTWASALSNEYIRIDIHAMYRLAALIDDFWKEPTKEKAAEIRQQTQAFGQTPLDRRRLQWEVQRVEEGKAAPGDRPAKAAPARDPRDVLRVLA